MALTSLASQEGRRVCGSRHDEQFDMAQLVVDEGTLYLLAEPEQIELGLTVQESPSPASATAIVGSMNEAIGTSRWV